MTEVIPDLLPTPQEEEKLTNIHGQDTTERILEHAGEAESTTSPFQTTETKNACIRNVGEAATH